MDIKIVTNEEELKKPCEKVTSVEEAKEIAELLKTAITLFDGAGLSANQIGINKRMSILRDPKNDFIYLINPELVSTENEFVFNGEGCISFTGRFFKTKRFEGYLIKNQVLENDKFREETQYYYCDPERANNREEMTISDLQGICCQHEMDHLDGKILIEYGFDQISGQIINNKEKVGRNDPCPCGKIGENGKIVKYKKCCGKV